MNNRRLTAFNAGTRPWLACRKLSDAPSQNYPRRRRVDPSLNSGFVAHPEVDPERRLGNSPCAPFSG